MGWRPFVITGIATLAADQLSKWLVVSILHLGEVGRIAVFPPYLNFHMAWNRGVNFGLFPQGSEAGRWLLVAVSLAICLWVVLWLRREKHRTLAMISGGVMVGGALGNVADRLARGAVADFLNVSCCGVDNPYAFNLADAAIFVGAVGLILFAGKQKAA